MKKTILILVLLTFNFLLFGQTKPSVPKNIIIMIGDGMGFEHINTALFYQGKAEDNVFSTFPIRLAMSTYPAELLHSHTSGYASSRAWNEKDYIITGFTESAAAGTALATGIKTKVDRIGMSVTNEQLTNITQLAKSMGKATGVITSVEFSHATPAAFSAHNISRINYSQIANEMLFSQQLDVIMGAGHPEYDKNGNKALTPDYSYVRGEKTWEILTSGYANEGKSVSQPSFQDINRDGKQDKWVFSDSRSMLLDIIANRTTPQRFLFVAPVYTTLSQERSNIGQMPYEEPVNSSIPLLEEMTLAGLNILSKNTNGFFLMVEGGAIDWASHTNNTVSLIEEQIYFMNAVEKTIQWVTEHNLWNETLLIVTADHECGYLCGGWSQEKGFIPVQDKGKGNIPQTVFFSKDHTNHLVPFFARGCGMEYFPKYATNYDYIRGYYLDITSAASFVKLFWNDKPVVYPALANICKNDSTELSASVSYLPATYQWYKDGKPLPGETKPVLKTSPEKTSEFYCLVNYNFVAVKTNTSKVTVNICK